ncbi:MAG: hypothetical protein L6V84_06905 [Oscillospiraceae bacterium]|nr:MAG: hypothetical protein L6V84_06905 [Oscillospiraceae bacterium]
MLLIANAAIYDAAARGFFRGDLLLEGGRIAEVSRGISARREKNCLTVPYWTSAGGLSCRDWWIYTPMAGQAGISAPLTVPCWSRCWQATLPPA